MSRPVQVLLGIGTFLFLCNAMVFGMGFFPLLLVMLYVYTLWRAEHDSGNPPDIATTVVGRILRLHSPSAHYYGDCWCQKRRSGS